MAEEPRTVCRTPTPGKSGVTRILTWKYDLLRGAILQIVGDAGANGFAFSALSAAVRDRLSADQLDRLGSVGWHVTSVKLNMEVEGELVRLPGKGSQRVVLGNKGSN